MILTKLHQQFVGYIVHRTQRYGAVNHLTKRHPFHGIEQKGESQGEAIKRLFVWLAILVLTFLLADNPPKHSSANPVQVTAVESQESPAQLNNLDEQPVEKPIAVQPEKPITNRQLGQIMAQAKGWTGDQWLCLEKLWTNESGWNHTVENYQGSGAYGIPQSLPASKMASHGADYLINPRTQIAWGLDYIQSRYKTPCGALSFWNAQYPHWY